VEKSHVEMEGQPNTFGWIMDESRKKSRGGGPERPLNGLPKGSLAKKISQKEAAPEQIGPTRKLGGGT